jgi:ribulose-phosphate 3-epimerase
LVTAPTITTHDPHDYRVEMEQAAALSTRVHIDLADGIFAPTKLIDPAKVWWPEDTIADIHLMYQDPLSVLDQLIELRPHLIILHAESDGAFDSMAKKLRQAGIKVGIAVLPETDLASIQPILASLDHVLIFSGKLGYHGGHADLSLLGKVSEMKVFDPHVEVGWDGGINANNVRTLVRNGVDVLNVGGYIQKAEHPHDAYATLKAVVDSSEDTL